YGVAAHLTETADSRLACAHGADRLAMALGAAQLYDRTKAFDGAGDKIERSLVRDQLAALIIIRVGQQCPDRDFREFGIAIKLLAVGISELGAFDLQMDEFGSRGIEAVELKSLEQRQLLQHHRALAPDAGLAHGIATVVVSQRRFNG